MFMCSVKNVGIIGDRRWPLVSRLFVFILNNHLVVGLGMAPTHGLPRMTACNTGYI